METHVVIFRALLGPPCGQNLPMQLVDWHHPNGENSVLFSCSKSICVLNDLRGALVNCPGSQEQALGGQWGAGIYGPRRVVQ